MMLGLIITVLFLTPLHYSYDYIGFNLQPDEIIKSSKPKLVGTDRIIAIGTLYGAVVVYNRGNDTDKRVRCIYPNNPLLSGLLHDKSELESSGIEFIFGYENLEKRPDNLNIARRLKVIEYFIRTGNIMSFG